MSMSKAVEEISKEIFIAFQFFAVFWEHKNLPH